MSLRNVMIKILTVVLFIVLIQPVLQGSGSLLYCQRSGFKFFENFTPNDYDWQPQNWAVLRDKRGFLYAANQGGLMEFDGVCWRKVLVPNQTVRSIGMDDTGTIYIGGIDELGFLGSGNMGELQYISLVNHLKENQKQFSRVWRINPTKEGVYFRTSGFLFRWSPGSGQMNVWKPQTSFNASFSCGGRLFIHQRKAGLMEMIKDSLQPVRGNETFADKRIYMMVPYDNRKFLIGTRSNGLYIYDGANTLPFPTEVDDYLKEKELYHAIRLSSPGTAGNFAMATLWGGLVIMDSQGRLKEIIDKNSGLQDDSIKYVYEDIKGSLWLALDIGISKVEHGSPFSIYDDKLSKLPGLVLSVVRHKLKTPKGFQNVLYAGTSRGLYWLAPDSFSHGKTAGLFQPVPGMAGMCFSLLSTGDSLLAATSNGVWQVENNSKRLVTPVPSTVLYRSLKEPDRIWVGTRQGLAALRLAPGRKQWKEEHRFETVTGDMRTIAEDKYGNLWLGTRNKGVLRVVLPAAGAVLTHELTANGYGKDHGLTSPEVRVFRAAEHVMFATRGEIFRFHDLQDRFIPDRTLATASTNSPENVFRLAEDQNKTIWFHSEFRNYRAVPQPGGTMAIHSKPFLRLPETQVNAIYPDPDGTMVWFACNGGLLRVDPAVTRDYRHFFPPRIRMVRVNGEAIFGGEGAASTKGEIPVFSYRDRNLRFNFAAPALEDRSANRYQTFLEGYDRDWSGWDAAVQKDYTNLDSGSYRFRVRARGVYGNLSDEGVYGFTISPPWYQRWWAMVLYILAFFLLTTGIVKWRSGKLVNEKQALETIIESRTREVHEKNRQLEEQSGKLQELDKVKSRFFANISHEFRTPLTLIMGPLEQMLSGSPGDEAELKRKLGIMLRNSQRLLHLINQLLELSTFESGKMTLRAARHDVILLVKGIINSFELAANQKQLTLSFDTNKDAIPFYFDWEKLEAVICNLLINAVKFTPLGGQITITVARNPGPANDFPSGWVELSVKDTGPGIPREQLMQIFDRFYQSASTYEHHRKGTGIGLALAKELVELHHGSIDVHNLEGGISGIEFVIRLPLGDAHLEPGERMEPSQSEPPRSTPVEIPVHELEIPVEMEETVPHTQLEYEHELEAGEEAGTEKKNTILVVEDSPDVRDYIKGSLEPVYRVVEAKDGKEGVEKAGEVIPDLIISDVMMPGMDGYQLCRTIKSDIKTCHIPVILLTSKASQDHIIEGLETGADDYITKPFNTGILLSRIKNLIHLRLQLQQTIQRRMTLQPVKIATSPMDEEFMKELQEMIEKNLSESDFGVDGLARRMYMNRTTVYRKIHALTGETPSQFIRSYRLKRGAELLRRNFGNVTETALEVGFSSSAYFTKCFKEKFRQLPSSYQAAESESVH